MEPIKLLIISEQHEFIDKIQNIVSNFKNAAVCGVFKNMTKFIPSVEKHRPNLIITDLSDKALLSLSLNELLLTGKYKNLHFINEFENIQIDLKPENLVLLAQTESLLAILSHQQFGARTEFTFKIKTKGQIWLVGSNKVEWIEANGPVSIFHLTDGTKLTSAKILQYYKIKLAEHKEFFQSSRSSIINVRYIKSINSKNNKFSVTMQSEDSVILSALLKDQLIARITSNPI